MPYRYRLLVHNLGKLCISLLLASVCHAPSSAAGLTSPPIYQLDLRIPTLHFIQNNEYLGPVVQGYTLAGYQLHPMLRFYPAEYLRTDCGVFVRRYWADPRFYTYAEPTCTLHYQRKGFAFTIGTLPAYLATRWIAPLYNQEQRLQRGPEPGMRLQYSRGRSWCDLRLTWLAWLCPAAARPEEFIVGLSAVHSLFHTRLLQMVVPIQGILYHVGGQGISVQSYSCVAGAIGAQLTLSAPTVCGSAYYLLNQYLASVVRPTQRGHALYMCLAWDTRRLSVAGSYWYGHHFSSENIGDPLYQSFVLIDRKVQGVHPIRQFLVLHLLYTYPLSKQVRLQVQVAPYYDIRHRLLEHAEGLYVTYSPTFRLKNVVDVAS
ncbi:MAG: hypothetical protein AAFU83_02290 [Bacteroidota bacterium]